MAGSSVGAAAGLTDLSQGPEIFCMCTLDDSTSESLAEKELIWVGGLERGKTKMKSWVMKKWAMVPAASQKKQGTKLFNHNMDFMLIESLQHLHNRGKQLDPELIKNKK